jgi:hypothetical protein
VTFTKVITIMSWLNSPPQTFSLIPHSPIPGIISTSLIFPFSLMSLLFFWCEDEYDKGQTWPSLLYEAGWTSSRHFLAHQ